MTNVIPILDKGATLTHWALLMPRAELSLGTYIKEFAKGPVPEDQVLPILVDIARALDGVSRVTTIHYKGTGIVHRDLKPANVLRWKGSWHLTDFGIARYAEKATDPHSRSHLWTREYAAPEQWIHERATKQTDVYAFGVMAFELLAGQRPFDEPKLRDKHIGDNPPTLTGVTPPLAAIVAMCLYKNPADRPTPKNLLRLLENLPPSFDRKSGFTALQQANLEVTVRHGQEIRYQFVKHGLQPETERQRSRVFAYESAGMGHRVDRPQVLYRDSYHPISAQVKAMIVRHAPACEEVKTESGWALRLGSATLSFSDPIGLKEMTSYLPFEVVAYGEISIGVGSGNGRAHSLWFCDAKREGYFHWFETAFVRGTQRRPYSPFALRPGQGDARSALGSAQGVGSCDVAWPFTSLEVDDVSAFADRWAGWFAVASQGGSIAKHTHPPEAGGSWRRAVKPDRRDVHELPVQSRQPPVAIAEPSPPSRGFSRPWRTTLRLALFGLFVAAVIIVPMLLRESAIDRTARTAELKCYVAFGTNPADASLSNNPFPCNAIPRDRVGRQSMWVFAELKGMLLNTAKEHDISIQCSEPTHSLAGSSVDMVNLGHDVRAEVSWNVDKPVDPLPAQLTCQVLEGNSPVRTESFELQTNPVG